MSEKYCGLCGTTLTNISYVTKPCWVQLDNKMLKIDDIGICWDCLEEEE